MAPRRNAKGEETAAPAAVSLSPRRTRSGAVGKRVAPSPAAPKPKKKIRFAGVKDKSVKVKEEKKKEAGEAALATGEAKSIIIEAWYCYLNSFLLLNQNLGFAHINYRFSFDLLYFCIIIIMHLYVTMILIFLDELLHQKLIIFS